MASFHCQVKTISRSDGRTATAAAAYRSGERIACDREGRTHDYTRKQGVEASFIHAPSDAPDWVHDRQALWNKAEDAETRKNARVAREWELALPAELSSEQREELARSYAKALVDRYGAVVDVAIHAPHRHGDVRNFHAHIMVTTRKISREGFGAKTRVLDDRKTGPREIEATREMWADMQNDRLERAGSDSRVDHRSLKEQREEALVRGDHRAAEALDRPPEVHMGPEVSEIERRAQREAKKEGRAYEAVTERGKAVHEVREAKTLLDRLVNGLEVLRGRWQDRDSGPQAQGVWARMSARSSALKEQAQHIVSARTSKADSKERSGNDYLDKRQDVARKPDSNQQDQNQDNAPTRQAVEKPVDKAKDAAKSRLENLGQSRERPQPKPKDRSNDWER